MRLSNATTPSPDSGNLSNAAIMKVWGVEEFEGDASTVFGRPEWMRQDQHPVVLAAWIRVPYLLQGKLGGPPFSSTYGNTGRAQLPPLDF